MASTYSILKQQLMATGENLNAWGSVTNSNLVAIEEAMLGIGVVSFVGADITLALLNTNSTQVARCYKLRLTGTSGGARTLYLPAITKPYMISNELADNVTVKNSTGTGLVIVPGTTEFVYNDGVNVVKGITSTATDAAKLNGQNPSYYLDLTNATGVLPVANLSGSYNINITGNATSATNATTATTAASATTATTATTAANALYLNGQNAAYYNNLANATGVLPVANLSGTYNVSITGNAATATTAVSATTATSATTAASATTAITATNSTQLGTIPAANYWHNGNMGSGSGLNADTVDGYHASDFVLASAGILAKGCFVGSTGALLKSTNIASVTRQGTGRYLITFTTPMADTNYLVIATPRQAFSDTDSSAFTARLGVTKTTTNFTIATSQANFGSSGMQDMAEVSFIVL